MHHQIKWGTKGLFTSNSHPIVLENIGKFIRWRQKINRKMDQVQSIKQEESE